MDFWLIGFPFLNLVDTYNIWFKLFNRNFYTNTKMFKRSSWWIDERYKCWHSDIIFNNVFSRYSCFMCLFTYEFSCYTFMACNETFLFSCYECRSMKPLSAANTVFMAFKMICFTLFISSKRKNHLTNKKLFNAILKWFESCTTHDYSLEKAGVIFVADIWNVVKTMHNIFIIFVTTFCDQHIYFSFREALFALKIVIIA